MATRRVLEEVTVDPYFLIGVCSIVSLTLTEAGQMEVVTRCRPSAQYMEGPTPDEVFKTVYGVEDGKIVTLHVVKGKHTPAEMVPEKIEFPQ